MQLFRVFSWDRSSRGSGPGGPFFIPRSRQGSGRHDNPSFYGAFYCSLHSISCIAEALQSFRGQTLTGQDLERVGNWTLALATLELSDRVALVDLDDPRQLDERKLRPSTVATADRHRTHSLEPATGWRARGVESYRSLLHRGSGTNRRTVGIEKWRMNWDNRRPIDFKQLRMSRCFSAPGQK